MLGFRLGLPLLSLVALPTSLATAQSPTLADVANLTLGLSASHVEPITFHGTPGQDVEALFELEGRAYRLDLAPHSVRGAAFAVRAQGADGTWFDHDAGPVRTVRGAVTGQAESQVAGAWHDDGLHAQIRLADGEMLWIQPALPHVPGAGVMDHVFYRNDDVLTGDHTCATDSLAEEVLNPVQEEALLRGVEPQLGRFVAEISCDADFEFFTDWGSVTDTQNRIELIINTVNVQFERDVNITHDLGTILVRTSSNQPYTSTNPDQILFQFRNHWNSAQSGIQRDVAHLFTGKNLNGSTIGIAYLSGICNPLGAGVSQSTQSSFACVTDLTAHELGHNWGSGHCSCTNFTMNPSLRCRNVFNPNGSIPSIRQFRNQVNCLDRECFEVASATPRNAGSNPDSLTVSAPLMGQPWVMTMDTGQSSLLLASVLVFKNPTQITLGNGSTLLGLPPELLNLQYLLGPNAQWSLDLPFDASLCGYDFVAQGIHYLSTTGQAEFELANAYDCVIGGL